MFGPTIMLKSKKYVKGSRSRFRICKLRTNDGAQEYVERLHNRKQEIEKKIHKNIRKVSFLLWDTE